MDVASLILMPCPKEMEISCLPQWDIIKWMALMNSTPKKGKEKKERESNNPSNNRKRRGSVICQKEALF